jgi:hypothetical protein
MLHVFYEPFVWYNFVVHALKDPVILPRTSNLGVVHCTFGVLFSRITTAKSLKVYKHLHLDRLSERR